MLASMPVALVIALLAAAPEAAPLPSLPDCEALQERIELTPAPAAKVAELCISPGIATTWLFEAPLSPGAVSLEGEAKEVLLVQSGRFLALLPSESLRPGRRLNMTVRFDDGAAPASAAFVLVVHPARAQRQVEVFRHQRSAASYQEELKAQQAEAQHCLEQNARLQAAQGRPDGLRGLISAGIVGQRGVAARTTLPAITTRPGSVLKAAAPRSYRAFNRVAVAVRLSLLAPVGAVPWVAEGAALIGPGGRELPVLGLWQEAPVTLGDEEGKDVIVEAEAQATEAQGFFSLKLWGAGGARILAMDGVTFPPLPD